MALCSAAAAVFFLLTWSVLSALQFFFVVGIFFCPFFVVWFWLYSVIRLSECLLFKKGRIFSVFSLGIGVLTIATVRAMEDFVAE